jgi:hypothetical protein
VWQADLTKKEEEKDFLTPFRMKCVISLSFCGYYLIFLRKKMMRKNNKIWEIFFGLMFN